MHEAIQNINIARIRTTLSTRVITLLHEVPILDQLKYFNMYNKNASAQNILEKCTDILWCFFLKPNIGPISLAKITPMPSCQ